jgi:hypothetical protein
MVLLLGTSILSFYLIEGLGFYKFWLVGVVFPFGALPYLYALSFAFQSEGNAQIVFLGITFMQMALMPMSILGSRMDFETEAAGDTNLWVYRLFPAYPLG